MKLIGFRVQAYRNILDSGWIDVAPLTVLVGKNEAGKTALLRALHKLNPSTDEEYDIQGEWPRKSRHDADPEHDVCTARFALAAEEIAQLVTIAGTVRIKEVEVRKDYEGAFSVDLPEDQFPHRPSPAKIVDAWATWPASLPGKTDGLEPEVTRLVEALRDAPETEWSTGFKDTLATQIQSLRRDAPPDPAFVTAITTQAARIGKALSALPTVFSEAESYLLDQLPRFIYIDDFRVFAGTARLGEVKQHVDAKKPTDQDRTVLMLMELAGLSLDDQVAKAQAADKLPRMLDLHDAGVRLSTLVKGRWTQGKYNIEFKADGDEFFTFVQVQGRDDALIKLEERSRGFQWFFSFDLMLAHQTNADFRNCVLLIDEPGLHLHPDGQSDLVKRLEAYSQTNTVIYTTHLPFMLNLREPQRIRVVSETSEGAVVHESLTQAQPEARLLLQSALGMSLTSSYLVASQNLVVEGVHDYWILSELSNLLLRSGLKGISEEALMTPAGGARDAAYLSTFMVGQNLEVVVLFDADTEGDDAGRKLVEKWLTRYKAATIQVLSLGPAAGVKDKPYALEDLFPEDFYLTRVKDVYKRELATAATDIPPLQTTGALAARTTQALSQLGITFNKGSVAKRIRTELIAMKSADDLPPATRAAAIKVVAAINRALTKASAQGAKQRPAVPEPQDQPEDISENPPAV